jgi:hypothetical protein
MNADMVSIVMYAAEVLKYDSDEQFLTEMSTYLGREIHPNSILAKKILAALHENRSLLH